jgi:hypothetical protein
MVSKEHKNNQFLCLFSDQKTSLFVEGNLAAQSGAERWVSRIWNRAKPKQGDGCNPNNINPPGSSACRHS